MSRFLSLAILAIVVTGALLHLNVELPWYFNWIGKLPGDMIIKKGNLTLYAPVTSSVLISLVLSIILSLFDRKHS